MNIRWKIIYYQTAQNKSPVLEFINSLDPKAKSKVINALDLLTEFGIRLGAERTKKLSGTNL